MLFRSIMITALLSALISGVVLGIMQSFATTPIIYSAEVYEVEEAPATDNKTAAHSHQHKDTVWSPNDGAERISYTFFADILIAFGHSLLLTSFLAFMVLKFHKPDISWRSGLLIGVGGYLSFYVATVIGLPPEVPGTVAADLQARQIWWVSTIATTILGLSILYLAPKTFKLLGLVCIILPHLIGAPHPEIHGFLNQDKTAVNALSHLEQQFFISTAWVNLVYWLVLGVLSGIFAKIYLRRC